MVDAGSVYWEIEKKNECVKIYTTSTELVNAQKQYLATEMEVVQLCVANLLDNGNRSLELLNEIDRVVFQALLIRCTISKGNVKSKRTLWNPNWCRLIFDTFSCISCPSLYVSAVSWVFGLCGSGSEAVDTAYASEGVFFVI